MLKFFKSKQKGHGQGHMFKIQGLGRKVLS